jgi:hypothetical protein
MYTNLLSQDPIMREDYSGNIVGLGIGSSHEVTVSAFECTLGGPQINCRDIDSNVLHHLFPDYRHQPLHDGLVARILTCDHHFYKKVKYKLECFCRISHHIFV